MHAAATAPRLCWLLCGGLPPLPCCHCCLLLVELRLQVACKGLILLLLLLAARRRRWVPGAWNRPACSRCRRLVAHLPGRRARQHRACRLLPGLPARPGLGGALGAGATRLAATMPLHPSRDTAAHLLQRLSCFPH